MPHFFAFKEDAYSNRRFKKCIKIIKSYKKYVDPSITCSAKSSNYVWTCWLQGTKKAPPVVKACINSIKKNFSDKRVVVITKDNLNKYVKIPNYILQKWNKGIISNTHFSDILRSELLSVWGGLWLDATVLCTGNIDRYVDKNTELFVFKNEHRGRVVEYMSSWLIYAKPNNPFLVNTRNLLYKYWEKNNQLADYFLFHIMFSICADVMQDKWNTIPFHSNLNPHILLFCDLFNPYDQKRFNEIKRLSNFHKLSYKLDNTNVQENSFYNLIEKGSYK